MIGLLEFIIAITVTFALVGIIRIILDRTYFSSYDAHEKMYQDMNDARQWLKERKEARRFNQY